MIVKKILNKLVYISVVVVAVCLVELVSALYRYKVIALYRMAKCYSHRSRCISKLSTLQTVDGCSLAG